MGLIDVPYLYMDSYDVLVIVLSVTLFFLLLIAIAVGIASYKLVKKLREIADKAKEIVDDVETVSGFFRKSAAPVAITGFVSNIVSKIVELNGTKKGKK